MFIRNFYHLIFILSIIFFFTSCQKKTEKNTNAFPTLGTCEAANATLGLNYDPATKVLTYRTKGGGLIKLDPAQGIELAHDDYEGFHILLWGFEEQNDELFVAATHESMNGKHVKDRQATRRSVIFPDGAKLTMVSRARTERLLELSIYEDGIVQHLNLTCHTLELSDDQAGYALHFDGLQADGETSAIEFTDSGLIWVNIYQEDTPGTKVENRVKLAEIIRAQPGVVNDYYDDANRSDT